MKLNKTHNKDCLEGMRKLKDNSIDLCVTSPPYYNAREYSQWDSLDNYYFDMENIFKEVFKYLGWK